MFIGWGFIGSALLLASFGRKENETTANFLNRLAGCLGVAFVIISIINLFVVNT